ncbi:hypothetical protein [Ferrimonas senticii]|uniref:hypothetical protein n=1 Tax=Ferrimonas senticii TaxID=394566 RepID=UPI0003F76BA8|nr:hypothetical protein [Ferrimonas senticii]
MAYKFALSLWLLSFSVSANQPASTTQPASTEQSPSPNQATTNANKPVLIESQVTGSTAQPKVTYIIPWQGTGEPIEVTGGDQAIVVPRWQPLNPTEFRKRLPKP